MAGGAGAGSHSVVQASARWVYSVQAWVHGKQRVGVSCNRQKLDAASAFTPRRPWLAASKQAGVRAATSASAPPTCKHRTPAPPPPHLICSHCRKVRSLAKNVFGSTRVRTNALTRSEGGGSGNKQQRQRQRQRAQCEGTRQISDRPSAGMLAHRPTSDNYPHTLPPAHRWAAGTSRPRRPCRRRVRRDSARRGG